VGLVGGLGAEYAFGNGFSLRAEYLHYAFNKSKDFPTNFGDQDVGDHFKIKDADVIRAALNYKFNLWH